MMKPIDSADRPALIDEIEITPEMIEAGVYALGSFDRDDPSEEIVAAVYQAMLGGLRCQQSREGP